MDLSDEELFRQRMHESYRQLAQDLHDRYNELDLVLGHWPSHTFDLIDPYEDLELQPRDAPWEEHCSHEKYDRIRKPPLLSTDAALVLRDREYGITRRKIRSKSLNALHLKFYSEQLLDYVSSLVPLLLKEKEFNLGTVNKVFASKWINESQVVMGTKCNKLLVMDVRNNNIVHIQSLKSSTESVAADCPCGIHSIAINPSGTLLATGAQNTNDVAVYELPTFDPLCVGEQAHKDWIFDMDWVDDEYLITGSRDSSLALWCVGNQCLSSKSVGELKDHGHHVILPYSTKICSNALRVRALSLMRNRQIMGVLSMNAKFHFWDVVTFQQVETINLHSKRENVCVASSEERGLFAVGSQSHVTLIDQRAQGEVKCQAIKLYHPQGVRSLSFNRSIITIGTGREGLRFYDTRMSRFICDKTGRKWLDYKVGDGWLCKDDSYRQHFDGYKYPNAVYTHCYDEYKGRLFVAGGPLPAGLYGNYAGLFH
ncbi:unnamed protein product [Lymnaea stagnalis]|uniref:DDB1- and CUL4-associated factor 12 beta-propeller domain-containing protein n=1 Tax=Lymnaea stagnalis TaxID=6523 RepID=A0AAV2IHM2_LYMST